MIYVLYVRILRLKEAKRFVYVYVLMGCRVSEVVVWCLYFVVVGEDDDVEVDFFIVLGERCFEFFYFILVRKVIVKKVRNNKC